MAPLLLNTDPMTDDGHMLQIHRNYFLKMYEMV